MEFVNSKAQLCGRGLHQRSTVMRLVDETMQEWQTGSRRQWRRENLAWHLARNLMFDAVVGWSHGKGVLFSLVLLATALLSSFNVVVVFACSCLLLSFFFFCFCFFFLLLRYLVFPVSSFLFMLSAVATFSSSRMFAVS
ncbi:uncharacterized protein B0I36DRAFT_21300 [Microdochium trichocladiopsis]|uniref:Transmembrane protein n=1 Tax=Microdochium trichocladiopsis TaxID=1682393 RepID=A0A9P9BWD6_9PEZI|nr:uncharacterized protein B0I36DRAFT_21300 [Microdochium trichocladiopsis]KAH7041278.1 hypothetical protein B0I36DRAFT_21300 [Microdochium trichocladiopsis]